jgi:hypothetical protein
MARREARLGRSALEPTPRIPNRVRWWIAAFFIVALVILFRERLPWLG